MNIAKCIISGCPAKAAANMRGLCMRCYSRAKKKVEAGETTWLELEQLLLARPAEYNDPFDAEFARKKESK